ncbi:MAG: hypothetical protein ACRETO_08980, partial [Gammaproteobacteria bacterium]
MTHSDAINPLGGIASRKRNRARRRETAHNRARAILLHEAPELLAATPDLIISAEKIDRLVSALSANKGGIDEVRWAHSVLTNILLEGSNTLGWKVEQFPPQIINAPRPPSVFRPETFSRTGILSEIIRRHNQVLEDKRMLDSFRIGVEWRDDKNKKRVRSPQELTVLEFQAAQLLFSAIVFGGLLSRDLVSNFFTSIETHLSTFEDLVWVDYELKPDFPEDRQAFRRWFPDPATICLLLNWRINGCSLPQKSPSTIKRLLTRYLECLGVFFIKDTARRRNDDSESVTSVHFTGIDSRLLGSYQSFRQASPMEFLLDAAETRLHTLVPTVLVS